MAPAQAAPRETSSLSTAPPTTVPSTAVEPEADAPAKSPAGESAAATTIDSAVYAYDAAGRLVGVTDPGGETARYRYDEVGNRLGVDRFPSTDLSVLSLVPVRAPAGATVTLSGTGFSATPADNTVSFGGTTAEVTDASANRLRVEVPEDAADGPVSVTTGGSTARSPEPFVLAPDAPTISSLQPGSGEVGAQVVLTGSGFAPAATDNVVRFGGDMVAEVVEGSDTALTVTVPPGAADGPVEVATPDGRAASAARFDVQGGSGEGVFETTAETSVTDDSPPTVSVTTPGNRARILFDAEQGDDIGFGFTGVTFNEYVTLRLIDPRGERVDGSASVGRSGGDWEVRDLPVTGTYTLVVDPGSGNIGELTVTVSAPAGGELDFTGGPAETAMSRAGQDGRWTFAADEGDSLSVGVDAAGMDEPLYARLYGPDGAQVESVYVSGGSTGSLDIASLSQAGRYRLFLDPQNGATGTAAVTGSHYADAGQLGTTGPETDLALLHPGQNGTARFAAEAGQRFSLGVGAEGFAS
ncbi:IPT/TIG domain-containing protein [Streptomyces sp. URMC 125]|uniref:IPT/TIG domain-containing protein n=1 Tax=Streptomyces sp. URMC 125 TaxID=3423419 RepID=UPI003F1CA312